MHATISLPVWAFAVLAFLAGWAVLDRLLRPAMRAVLRRRANRVIDELNTRPAETRITRSPSAFRMLLSRHLVTARNGLFEAVPAELPLLRYYANAIAPGDGGDGVRGK